jgi:hypothetical protein
MNRERGVGVLFHVDEAETFALHRRVVNDGPNGRDFTKFFEQLKKSKLVPAHMNMEEIKENFQNLSLKSV